MLGEKHVNIQATNMNQIYLNSKLQSRRIAKPNTLSGKNSRENGTSIRDYHSKHVSGEYYMNSNSKMLMQISYLNSDINSNMRKAKHSTANTLILNNSNQNASPSRPDSNRAKINLKLSNTKRITASKHTMHNAES